MVNWAPHFLGPSVPFFGKFGDMIIVYQLNFITVFVTLGAQLSRGLICRTNIFQGPDLPQQHFKGAQFAETQYAETQFGAKSR